MTEDVYEQPAACCSSHCWWTRKITQGSGLLLLLLKYSVCYFKEQLCVVSRVISIHYCLYWRWSGDHIVFPVQNGTTFNIFGFGQSFTLKACKLPHSRNLARLYVPLCEEMGRIKCGSNKMWVRLCSVWFWGRRMMARWNYDAKKVQVETCHQPASSSCTAVMFWNAAKQIQALANN